ncbi:EAL domain-containing protein [Methylobacterium sp. sgz302541]|uniref:EAL domain-containing protein n=1 Tax=unclassified Methylobacterium TaxID=2615210 RepID=UPI003D327B15
MRRWRLGRPFGAILGTIRGHILVAFLAMSAITGSVGALATITIRETGALAERTYDHSLMSINYARAAAADFAKMRTALARRAMTQDPAIRARLDDELTELDKALAEDLVIAVERAQTERAARAANAVQAAVLAWDAIRATVTAHGGSSADWDALDEKAAQVDGQIDLLVNYTAGDGFQYRQTARKVVAQELEASVLATMVAVALSGLVAWLLIRRITGPLAAASSAAQRIAGGHLDDPIESGQRDEMGALLRAMAAMRDNIRAMMEREVLQRRSAQSLLADALETSRDGVVVVDSEGRIVLANAQAADFFPNGSADGGDPAKGVALSLIPSGEGEIQIADGRWLRVSRSATQAGGFVAMCSDITLLKSQKESLKATNLRLDAALDNMTQGLCLYDAQDRLIVVNRRYGEIYNLAPGTITCGMHATEVVDLCITAGNHPGLDARDVIFADVDSGLGSQEARTYIQHLGDGRVIAIEKRPTDEGGFVATYEDVTERRHAEARIAFMSRHDTLTDLPNRHMLGEHIEQAVAQAGRDGGFALLQLDLDDFKPVNDAFGQAVGDELIRAAANRLAACVREIDVVARLGADEFVVLQRGIERPEDSAVLARRIVEILSAPYALSDHTVTVGVSIGITVAPGDGMIAEKLLKNTAVALDRAKAEARGSFRFFEPDMDARLQERRQLEHDLREAVANEAFEVYYQPIYDLGSERIGGFEALLRWRHPVRGPVSPAVFIPVAEEMGLITPLGEWVLRKACAEATRWPEDLKIAVNVSAVQFSSANLVDAVCDALGQSGLVGRRLELEITESVLVANPHSTTAILHSLKQLGVRVSMDDFGTGYSALSYLRSFPFDKIKIDQSFVRDLCEPDGSGFIVRAVIGLGASLGMTTTAEGVETEEQLERLRDEGCDEVQGYFFSPPVPASQVAGILERWNRTSIRAVA